jgi:hypothetical protein
MSKFPAPTGEHHFNQRTSTPIYGAIRTRTIARERSLGTRSQALRRVVFSVLLTFIAVAQSFADVRILSSPGGEVREYLEVFALLRRSGERIVIDGPCFSACTLVLSTIPENRICVTPRAVLGFHAARWVDGTGRMYAASDETHLIAATYPAAVQAWIKRRGGLKRKPIFLRGRELAAMFPRCS